MAIRRETIGTYHRGVEGNDQYLLVSDSQDELYEYQVDDYIRHHFYADTTQEAGGYFCHTWTIMRKPWSSEYIVIVHHRYDV